MRWRWPLLLRPGARCLAVLGGVFVAAPALAQEALAGPSPADPVALAVRALPEPGAAEWVLVVRRVLLRAHDQDASGWLDAGPEVGAVTCATWSAVDAGVRARWQRGVWDTYGVGGGSFWLASVLGVDVGVRGELRRALVGCGLGPAVEAGGGTPPRPPTASGDPVARILALDEGGTNGWDAEVRHVLVGAYDTDASGMLDEDHEVDAMPCEVWLALDAGVREQWPAGLYLTYGFDQELVWIGDALGLDEVTRTAAVDALRACRVPGAQTRLTAPTDPWQVADRLAALPDAGGALWTEIVRSTLLRMYDADHSSWLDATDEVRGVPCALWSVLDLSLRRDRGKGLLVSYGFDPDRTWRGWTLGLQGPVRAIAEDAVRGCGLPEPSAAPTPADTPDRLAAPLVPFDLDLSGRLDAPTEVRRVSCASWQALEAEARRETGVGAVDRYGLHPGPRWAGDTVGIAAGQATATRRALDRCARR